jgi:hypothetical protein
MHKETHMKKTKKLVLNRQTLRNLSYGRLSRAIGVDDYQDPGQGTGPIYTGPFLYFCGPGASRGCPPDTFYGGCTVGC